MGRKKRKQLKPWCWYCDKEFMDEDSLTQHQRNKHFHCLMCFKKFATGRGLAIHCNEAHEKKLEKVHNALSGRTSIYLEITGTVGIPIQDVIQREEKLLYGGNTNDINSNKVSNVIQISNTNNIPINSALPDVNNVPFSPFSPNSVIPNPAQLPSPFAAMPNAVPIHNPAPIPNHLPMLKPTLMPPLGMPDVSVPPPQTMLSNVPKSQNLTSINPIIEHNQQDILRPPGVHDEDISDIPPIIIQPIALKNETNADESMEVCTVQFDPIPTSTPMIQTVIVESRDPRIYRNMKNNLKMKNDMALMKKMPSIKKPTSSSGVTLRLMHPEEDLSLEEKRARDKMSVIYHGVAVRY